MKRTDAHLDAMSPQSTNDWVTGTLTTLLRGIRTIRSAAPMFRTAVTISIEVIFSNETDVDNFERAPPSLMLSLFCARLKNIEVAEEALLCASAGMSGRT